ncbi:MAG TPA: LuxR C-terminal-related transcriptional regulator [Spirochaetota bacterium]|nr:LuxR C-terminal-related transcriptional regulator [Spirochaetota bacterium]
MAVKILIYCVTALFCIECGITVYRLNRRALANRLYAAAAFLYAVFSLVYVHVIVAPDAAAGRAWFVLHAALFFIVVMLIMDFIMALTRYRNLARNPLFLALLYGSGACVIAGVTCILPVVKGFYRSPWGGTVIYDIASPWFWAVFNYSSLALVPGIAALANWRKQASSGRVKKQAGMILLAALATMLLSLVQNALILLLPAETTILLSDAFHHAVAMFFIASIRFAIWKYKLLAVDASSPASELFSGISDAVFLADRKGVVVFMNDSARNIALRDAAVHGALSLSALFAESDHFQKVLRDALSGASTAHTVTLGLTGRDGAGMLELFMYPLKNEGGGVAGVLVIARENPGLGDLQKQAGLTARELEVLLLLGNGQSAGSIAEECGITLQTAKSHIHNIYRKTGLSNRVELANLLNKHS